jgi:ribonuclease-3
MQSKTSPKPISELATRLGYEFKDIKYLELSCIHKSFGNEKRANERIETRDNERLEFLGDAILDLVVSMVLLETFPELAEGDLSKLRAGLVNERTLAKIAKNLEIGEYISLGKGEEGTGGRNKDSILASTLEAIIAAVFSDGGFPAAETWVRNVFAPRIKASRDIDALQDFKTKLQEVVQAKFRSAPRYEVIQSSGPDHDKTFQIQLVINGEVIAEAIGKSKKEAEQSAAKIALDKVGADRKPL